MNKKIIQVLKQPLSSILPPEDSVSLDVGVSLSDAVELMIHERLSNVLVKKDGKLVGSLNSNDLLKGILECLYEESQAPTLHYGEVRKVLQNSVNGLVGELSSTGI